MRQQQTRRLKPNGFRQTILCLSFLSFFFSAFQSGYSQDTAAQNNQPVMALELGKSVEREIVAGQKHDYKIGLSENQ